MSSRTLRRATSAVSRRLSLRLWIGAPTGTNASATALSRTYQADQRFLRASGLFGNRPVLVKEAVPSPNKRNNKRNLVDNHQRQLAVAPKGLIGSPAAFGNSRYEAQIAL